VVLVSTDFPVPLGLRFQRKGEDEVACALALLQELVLRNTNTLTYVSH